MSHETSLDAYLGRIPARNQAFLRALLAQGASLEALSVPHRLLVLSYQDKERLLFREQPYFNQKPSTLFTKHKELTKLILERAGIPVPRGFSARSSEEIRDALRRRPLAFPVVLKPADAAKGIGVTVGIESPERLARRSAELFAYLKDSPFAHECLVEEVVPGKDYRILVLFGTVLACAERVPAFVLGNGGATIEELIAEHNQGRPRAFALDIDDDLMQNLTGAGFTLSSVPGTGQRISLRKNANISSGGIALDHTPRLSRRMKEAALTAAEALGLNFCGVDLMTEDIASDSAPFRIIEVNGAPDYDIHEAPIMKEGALPITETLARKTLELL